MKTLHHNKKLKYSDLLILSKLLTGSEPEIFVFDPDGAVEWDVNESSDSEPSDTKVLFNFGGELLRFKEFELNEFEHIVDFSRKMKSEDLKMAKLSIVQSPSGVARYLFERNCRKGHFLNFFPTPSFRSRLIKAAMKGLVSLGLMPLMSKSFNILSSVQPYYLKLADKMEHNAYALFFGTPGLWRKPVLQLIGSEGTNYYTKIGISPQSNQLINMEKRSLSRVRSLQLNHLEVPAIRNKNTPAVLFQTALQTNGAKRLNYLGEKHFSSLKELMIKSMKIDNIKGTPYYSQILDQMYFIRNHREGRFEKMYFLLDELKAEISGKINLPLSMAHGDFTPWNIVVGEASLAAYDWELALSDAPLLYDAFHFVYQSEVLVKRKDFLSVEMALEEFFRRDDVRDFIERFDIDLDLHHRLYLLHAVSKNIALFCQQSRLSNDQKLLMETWKQALTSKVIPKIEEVTREVFLSDFQAFLADKNYAALKFFDKDFFELKLSSDLDLAVSLDEVAKIEAFIQGHVYVGHVKVIKKTFMTVIQIYFLDNAFLSIDLIHDFMRKGKRYMDIDAVLGNARFVRNIKRPLIFHDIEYAQHFYTLNHASIPLKYQNVFLKVLLKNRQSQIYLDSIGRKYNMQFNNLLEAFTFSTKKQKKINKYISKKYEVKGLARLRKKVCYLLDFLVDLKQNKGFMVTFSGVDGAGKTTIINAVKKKFEQTYRKEVVLLRHRPGLLPILSSMKHGGRKKAEKFASGQKPRQGKNKNKLSSALRFMYYFTDYFFGQIYVYFKYILRGKIVLYDRYYFDFINDSRRSNINLNPSFVKRCFALIYKPEFNFFLYNDPQVILERKKELDASEIEMLNQKYTGLFDELEANGKGTYCQIKNETKWKTVARVFNVINKVA